MHRGQKILQWNELAMQEAGAHSLGAFAVAKVGRGLGTAI
jgi:hypothetical protein